MTLVEPARVADPGPLPEGLRVRGLTVAAGGGRLLDDVDLDVRPGQVVAVVGPSGAGKSTLLRALLGRLPQGLEATWRCGLLGTEEGSVDLAATGPSGWREVRRRHVRLVAQDPVAALTPLRRVDSLVAESLRLAARPAEQPAVVAVLARAGFADPGTVLRRRTHELSGGMAQRVGVALALAARPALLLADEPTTALDPVAREAVLATLRQAADAGAAVVLVTHDGEAVAAIADRTVVLSAGRVVGAAGAAATSPPGAHPPHPRSPGARRPGRPPALQLDGLVQGYADRVVLDGVRLVVAPGEVVGLRGPSGSGKTTLLEAVVTGVQPRAGTVRVGGDAVPTLSRRELRRRVQLVPQHPREALNPWRSAVQLVREPLDIHRVGPRRERRARATALLAALGLGDRLDARPAELSTGQCQRVCLARALVLDPELLLADEPVTSLDAELADEALAMLAQAARGRGAGLLLVSHDHRRLEAVCDRVLELDALGRA